MTTELLIPLKVGLDEVFKHFGICSSGPSMRKNRDWSPLQSLFCFKIDTSLVKVLRFGHFLIKMVPQTNKGWWWILNTFNLCLNAVRRTLCSVTITCHWDFHSFTRSREINWFGQSFCFLLESQPNSIWSGYTYWSTVYVILFENMNSIWAYLLGTDKKIRLYSTSAFIIVGCQVMLT